MGLAAVPAEADDTAPCPAGTVRVVVGQFCFGGLLSTETCQNITACKRLVLHIPHRPIRALVPPPTSHPFPGPALHAHPIRKLR
jgi:hypothetical protein